MAMRDDEYTRCRRKMNWENGAGGLNSRFPRLHQLPNALRPHQDVIEPPKRTSKPKKQVPPPLTGKLPRAAVELHCGTARVVSDLQSVELSTFAQVE